jgi:hypothetical protein
MREAYIDRIIEQFQMNNSHPMLFFVDPNTWLTKEVLGYESQAHCLYHSIMYLECSYKPIKDQIMQILSSTSHNYL